MTESAAGLRIGFALPCSGSWATPDNVAEIAATADALGYHSLWTFQRLLHPAGADWDPVYRSVIDPVVTLAYAAALAPRARLGLAVVNLPFYPPVVLAKQLTSVDLLSGGRLDAGLGLGWAAEEFQAAGVSMRRRGDRAEEYLRCLKAIWTQPVVRFDGEFYTVPPSRIDPKPVQRPHPPLLLGAMSRPALRRAGRLADGWVSSSRTDLHRIAESVALVRGSASEAGRDPEALRCVVRGVVRVRPPGAAERTPLTGSLTQIRGDLPALAGAGIDEVFVDLNFDPQVGSPDADPAESMRRARDALAALAPA